jgi:hypothetical protein
VPSPILGDENIESISSAPPGAPFLKANERLKHRRFLILGQL